MKLSATVAGADEILKTLGELKTTGQKKVARVSLQAGLKVIGEEMKRQVDPRVKHVAKQVGYRITIHRQMVTRAKVGFNVGKRKASKPRRRKAGSAGVGIGPANLHWFISGTKERFKYGRFSNGKSRRASKRLALESGSAIRTGAMPAQQPGLAANSYKAVAPIVRLRMQQAASKYLAAMAARAEKKNRLASQNRLATIK